MADKNVRPTKNTAPLQVTAALRKRASESATMFRQTGLAERDGGKSFSWPEIFCRVRAALANVFSRSALSIEEVDSVSISSPRLCFSFVSAPREVRSKNFSKILC
jgi:hypothetical protein